MRLPVAATDRTPRGFTWTRDGELVMAAFVCDRDAEDPDGGCGCGRAFAGLDTHKATTLAVVRELPLGLADLHEVVRDSLAKGGWMPEHGPLPEPAADMVVDVAVEMVEIGELFPEGTRLARRADDVFAVV